LWHGASWTFVIWGALHGLYLVVSTLTSPLREKLRVRSGLAQHPQLAGMLGVAVTFSLVTFAWIFFRANTLQDAYFIATHWFRGLSDTPLFIERLNLISASTGITLAAVVVLELVQYLQRHQLFDSLFYRRPRLVRWAAYYILIGWILFFGPLQSQQFIYFQF